MESIKVTLGNQSDPERFTIKAMSHKGSARWDDWNTVTNILRRRVNAMTQRDENTAFDYSFPINF